MCWSVYPVHPCQAHCSILHVCRVFCNKTLLTKAPGILIFPGNWFGTPGKHFETFLPHPSVFLQILFSCLDKARLDQPRQTQCRKALVSFLSYTKFCSLLWGSGGVGRWEFILTSENGTIKSLREFIFLATIIFSVNQDDSRCTYPGIQLIQVL